MSAWQCWQGSDFEGRLLECRGQDPRVTVSEYKSCMAGTHSRVFFALWMPRVCGKIQDQLVDVPKVEQRTKNSEGQ